MEMDTAIANTLIVVLTSLISFLAFEDAGLETKYLFRPEAVLAEKEYYRLFTSGFLHGGWGHLLVNMYTLYSFGGVVEMYYGHVDYLLIYFGSIVGGNLLSLFLHRWHDYAALGASGGVCGVIFAYVLHHPASHMTAFPLPYTVPAWLFAIVFLVASFYALKYVNDNIGHDAHMGGAMLGLLIAALTHPEVARRHWLALLAMLVVGGLIFTYLLVNPMFLPLSSFVHWPPRLSPKARPRRGRSQQRPPTPPRPAVQRDTGPELDPALTEPDWLRQELEIHVGKLEKDKTGAHDWIDKFGRSYDVIAGQAEQFEFSSWTAVILARLRQPGVDFVVVDTRRLREHQVDSLRPFFADLPDAQFKRVIRSFALRQRF
jgi:membrane associated rhomboid family serine protease